MILTGTTRRSSGRAFPYTLSTLRTMPLTQGDPCPVDGDPVDIAVQSGDPGGLTTQATHVCVVGTRHPKHGGKRVYHDVTGGP